MTCPACKYTNKKEEFSMVVVRKNDDGYQLPLEIEFKGKTVIHNAKMMVCPACKSIHIHGV